jgi:hypothetical protein
LQGLIDFALECSDPLIMDGVSAVLLNVCKGISPAAAMEFPLASLAPLLLWADAHGADPAAASVLASLLTSLGAVLAVVPTTAPVADTPSVVSLAGLTTLASARASADAGLFAEMVEEVKLLFGGEVLGACARVLHGCLDRQGVRAGVGGVGTGRTAAAAAAAAAECLQDDLQLERCVGQLIKALCLFDPAALASMGGAAARAMAKPVYLPSPKAVTGGVDSAALLPAFTAADAHVQGILECVASVEGLGVCKLLAQCEDSDALAASAFAFSTLSRHAEFRASLARSEVGVGCD